MLQGQVWYRHPDDPDQSIRSYSQVILPASTEAEVVAYGERLRGQGYNVQRIETATLCEPCQGVGFTMVRPKGWRKKSCPSWAMARKTCSACNGAGNA